MPEVIPDFADAVAMICWLGKCRNDLEAPAQNLAPEIGKVLETLSVLEGAGLARMSGSGATCFGLFGDNENAQAAEARLRSEHPNWWVRRTILGDQSAASMPLLS